MQESYDKIAENNISVINSTEINRRILQLGLAPSPSGFELSYYKTISENNPNLALAGLRLEVETLLNNLAKGFNVEITDKDYSIKILMKLKENGCVTDMEYLLIKNIIYICDAAIHGLRFDAHDANEIINIATVLRVCYAAWLVVEFSD